MKNLKIHLEMLTALDIKVVVRSLAKFSDTSTETAAFQTP
jgi:hypothetical protein